MSVDVQSIMLLASVILLQHPDEALILVDFNQPFGTLSQDHWCCVLNFLISNDATDEWFHLQWKSSVALFNIQYHVTITGILWPLCLWGWSMFLYNIIFTRDKRETGESESDISAGEWQMKIISSKQCRKGSHLCT